MIVVLLACSDPIVPTPPEPGEPILAERPVGGDPVVAPAEEVKPEVERVFVKPTVAPDIPAPAAGSDAETIARVARKSQGRVLACLERTLMVDPSTNGRVTVGWTITAGRVTEAHLVSNTTGDDQLGRCIVGATKQFRFPPEMSATVAEFPWVLSGS